MTETNSPPESRGNKSRWGLWGGLVSLVVLILVTGGVLWKNQSVHESALTPFWEPTITFIPTHTWTPSATSTPSVTPTLTITPTPTPPVIGADFTPNLSPLVRLAGMDTFTGAPGNRYNYSHQYDAMAFSPDGSLLATAAYPEGVQVTELSTGRVIQQWKYYSDEVVFSADSAYLFAHIQCSMQCTASFKMTIQKLSLADGSVEWEMPAETYGGSFSSDGRYFARPGETIQIIDLLSQEIVFEIPGNYGMVLKTVFSPNESLIAVATADGIIRIWKIGEDIVLMGLNTKAPYIRDLAFSPDGSMLAAISSQGKAWIWRTSDWGLLPVNIPVYASLVNIAFSPDGRMLVVTSLEKNEVDFIDIMTWNMIHVFKQHAPVGRIRFSTDGYQLAASTSDGILRVWGLKYAPYAGSADWTMTETLMREFPGGHSAEVISVAFSPDGSMLASGSADRTVKIWRTDDWLNQYTLIGHERAVEIVAFAPGSGLLASGSDDKTIRIWDTQSGALVKVLEGHQDAIFALAFSPDGSLLASGSADRTVKVWRVSDWSLITTLEDHRDWVWSVAFSPDGKLLASASSDSYVRLWQVSDWQMLEKFGEGGSYAGAVAFSPDQTILARAGWDGLIRLYDSGTAALIRTLKSPNETNDQGEDVNPLVVHTNRIWSIAFSRDASLLIAGSLEGKVRIWRVSDGELLQNVESEAQVYSVSLAPNGWWLAAASGVDVTIWGLPRWDQIPEIAVTLQPTSTP